MKELFKRVGLGGAGKPEETASSSAQGQTAQDRAKAEAKRLLDLIDKQPGARGQPDANLKRLAAELVARVERRETGKSQNAARAPQAKPGQGSPSDETINTLGYSARLRNKGPDAADNPQPKFTRAQPHPKPASTREATAGDTARQRANAPVVVAQARTAYQQQAQASVLTGELAPLAPPRIEDLLDQAFREQTLGAEHPAVIAMALKDRSRKQQANALRKLPPALVRGVQRLLI